MADEILNDAVEEEVPEEGVEEEVEEESPDEVRTFEYEPVTPEYGDDEVAALQAYVRNAAAQLQQYQNALRQYELQGLDEPEKEKVLLQQQQQALAQQEYAMKEWYAKNQLYNYYKQWAPEDRLAGTEPMQWQHSALSYLHETALHYYNEAERLANEVKSLRRGLNPGSTPPRVSTGSGAPPAKKSLWDMNWDQIQAFKNAAVLGQVGPEDYPAI